MGDTDKKIFEKEHEMDAIVRKSFGLKKKADRETEDTAEAIEEKYAVEMGLQEIRKIQSQIKETIDKLGGLVLAQDFIAELLEINDGFEHIAKVLTLDFNPLKMIAEGQEGAASYREMIRARKQWISELLEKYNQNGEET